MIKDIIGIALIVMAVILYIIEVIGVYRFDYVLNRMHATAIGDSLGILLALLGAGLLMWDWFSAAKLLVILALVWLTSPVASHLLARVETMTNNHLESYLEKPITEVGHTLKGDPNGDH
ncbi:MAG: monovalent cation/H(+) antiporter subunit G [Clostridia bacterium]|nr:monovalent cation/H(+) antiporter subunit G [Clostridia bacterium]